MTIPLSTDDIAARIEALAAPVAAERDCVLYDVEVRRHGRTGTVRILADKAASEPGTGVTVGELAELAREVGFLLDTEDFLDFTYTFEVSSPGVERSLRNRRQFEANLGAEVRLVLGEVPAPNGDRVVQGVLQGVENDDALVRVGEETWRVALSNVRRGKTVYNFGGAAKK